MKKITFIDAGVLIAASHGTGEVARRALEVLNDPERAYASSRFVKLEVLPKARYFQRIDEVAFYEAFFQEVSRWAEPIEPVLVRALGEAPVTGLSAMDALHVAAAAVTGASELVTTEKPGKPIHRALSVAVRSIRP